MTGFKSFLHSHRGPLSDSNARVTLSGTTLSLRLDSHDKIISASYEGPSDIWMGSLCEILKEMSLAEARFVDLRHWELVWKDDQFFWDMKLEVSDKIFFAPLELLHAALDVYQGKEFLYRDESPLICRCFGVREKDVVEFLQTAKDPTLDELLKRTKAGMGCRSCVPQLRRWFTGENEKSRLYKSRPIADWVLQIDHELQHFPEAKSWNMNVESMKGNTVIISHDYSCSQRAEEETGKKLQGFLGSAVDADLVFFLRLARQR
jgi:bacterioferritin-associated ferredoxin